MLTTLDHFVIAVADLDAATATYSRLLGRAPSWRGEHPGAGTANALFRFDRTYAELLAPNGPGSLGDSVRAHLDASGEGPFAVAFGTDDAAACAALLRERGLTVTDPSGGGGRERASGVERTWRTVLTSPAQTRGVRLFAIEHRSPPTRLPVVTPEARGPVTGVDHLVIMTSDPQAGIALYRDRLGLRLAFDRTFEARHVRLLFFRIGGVTVELAAPLGASAASAPDRFWGVSWRVGDVDAARVRLANAGFDVSEVRPGNKPGTRVCTVRAPTHGVATLLIEPVSASSNER